MSILLAMTDDVDIRLASFLLAQIDPDVVSATSIAEAHTCIESRSWTAVILDFILGDGHGFELLAHLQEIDFEGAVIVLSASREVADKVRALDQGADDYVVRPYEPSEFLARVRAVLRRTKRRIGHVESQVLRVGDLELDLNAMMVTSADNRRERLTPNELRLLHYLMLHSQRVVDHQELLTRLFGTAEHGASSNAVGVYMRRVRRKIERDPDNPRYIVTVRGSGYRFQADNSDTPTDSQPPTTRRRRRGVSLAS